MAASLSYLRAVGSEKELPESVTSVLEEKGQHAAFRSYLKGVACEQLTACAKRLDQYLYKSEFQRVCRTRHCWLDCTL